MIKCLHDQGLNVVMDVVFNHTYRAADDPDAILDKIVPAYYYRTNQDLKPHQSTCCPDTATERPMMLKLMADSILRFAKHYHIDGFRFDLMGHHTVQNLSSVRKVLDTLPSGSDILLYGEGWAFGSLHDKQGYLPMNQSNAAGTGVGTFNDCCVTQLEVTTCTVAYRIRAGLMVYWILLTQRILLQNYWTI